MSQGEGRFPQRPFSKRSSKASALAGSETFFWRLFASLLLDNSTGDDLNVHVSINTKQYTAVMLQLEQYFNDEKVLLKIPALFCLFVCFFYYVSDHNHKSFVVGKAFVRCLVNTGAWQKHLL